MSYDWLGNMLLEFGTDTAIQQLVPAGAIMNAGRELSNFNGAVRQGVQSARNALMPPLPPLSERQPIWDDELGWRMPQPGKSPRALNAREMKWFGTSQEEINTRLLRGDAKRERAKAEADRAADIARAERRETERTNLLAEQIRQQGAQGQRQHEQTMTQLQNTDNTQNRALTIQETGAAADRTFRGQELAAMVQNQQDRLALEREIVSGNEQQRDFQNQLLMYDIANKQAYAEQARIAGIADSLARAFSSLKF